MQVEKSQLEYVNPKKSTEYASSSSLISDLNDQKRVENKIVALTINNLEGKDYSFIRKKNSFFSFPLNQ